MDKSIVKEVPYVNVGYSCRTSMTVKWCHKRGRIFFCHGREQGVLRQAINDEKVNQEIKVYDEQTRFMEERAAKVRAC